MPVGLGLFQRVYLMRSNAATATDRFHEHRKRYTTVGQSSLESVPVMKRKRGPDSFLCEIFKKLVFIKTINRTVGGRAERDDPGSLESSGISSKNLYLGVYKGGYRLNIVLAAYIENSVYVAWICYTRHYIRTVTKLESRSGRLQISTYHKACFTYRFLYITQQAPTTPYAAEEQIVHLIVFCLLFVKQLDIRSPEKTVILQTGTTGYNL